MPDQSLTEAAPLPGPLAQFAVAATDSIWLAPERHSVLPVLRGLGAEVSSRSVLGPTEAAAWLAARPGRSIVQVRVLGRWWELVEDLVRNDGFVQAVRAGGVLLVDGCTEAGPFNRDVLQAMHRLLAPRVPLSRVVVLFQNERTIPGYDEMCAEQPETARMRLTVFHYWMLRILSIVRRNAAEARGPGASGSRSDPTFRFLCLNHALRPHRAAVVGRMVRCGLIQRSLVSLGSGVGVAADDPDAGRSRVDLFGAAAAALPECVADIAAAAAATIPLTIGNQGQAAGGYRPIARADSLLVDAHAQTAMSIITETEMSNQILRFTEKTLKALTAGQPFVVAGNWGTLALLRTYGFKTFEPFVDERYDLIRDDEQRLLAVLAEIERLGGMTDEEFGKGVGSVREATDHNARHMREGLWAVMDRQIHALCKALRDAAATLE